MRGKKLRNLFVSIISTISIMAGALCGAFPGEASLSFAASEAVIRKPNLAPGEPTTNIRIGTWYQDYDLTNLSAYLTEQFPNYTFEFEYVDKSNYEPIMDSKLSYKGAPDILYVDQEMVEKHAKTRYILNLSDYVDNFTDEAKLAFEYGNAVYAVPNTSQFECIFYNKKLFREKNVSIPDSFDTFIGSCDNLRLVKGITPIAISLKDPYALSNSALAMLSADYFSTDRGSGFGVRLQYGRTTFMEEIKPFMNDWESLIWNNVFTNDMYTMDKLTAIEKFVREEAAMIVGGPETYKAIMRLNPEMEIGTMPFFGSEGAKKAIIGGCDLGFAVNANSENLDQAVEVVVSLATARGQEALWKDRPGSKTYLKFLVFENTDVFNGIQDCYAQGLVFTPWMDWGFELNKQTHFKLGRELQKVLLGRETIDEALSNIDRLVFNILHEG